MQGETSVFDERLDVAARVVVNSAYTVHRALGPGLLETIYEQCLSHEIRKAGLKVECQVARPLVYDGLKFDSGLRLDLLVDDIVIVEVKSVLQMHPVYDAQVLSYLKITGLYLGLLINFNVPLIKEGIKRIRL